MRRSLVYPIISTISWGSNYVVGKILILSMDPLLLSLLRFLVATPVVLIMALIRGSRIRSRDMPMMVLVGLLGIAIFNASLYSSLIYISPSTSSLIITTSTAITYIIALALGLERTGWRQVMGSSVSLIGVYFLMSPHLNIRDWLGVILALVSATSWSLYTILVRKLSITYTPEGILAWSMVFGTISLSPVLITRWVTPNPWEALFIIYVALVPGVIGYMFWNRGVRELGASLTSMFLPISPLVATILSTILLGETLSIDQILGGTFVIIGTLLIIK